ncbi:hypothetical protein [Sediminibacterium sp.]|uniref:hypothetical protein n=1 Tax=Sediminibacterium sp. TaxID=1917865 RepID=UPI0027375B6A|nr:hypothetical protein [Sediminibacterium sp.]MDP3393815.1 hypothetical protein [Sediminibacterium sp.]MDP3568855.1 hypothetical protein [Sediminibacterium sp.]
MLELTKKTAFDLDALLTELVKTKGNPYTGSIILEKFCKENEKYNESDFEYLRKLLFLAMVEQKREAIPDLIGGTRSIQLFSSGEPAKDFLNNGGFSKIIKSREDAKKKQNKMYWVTNILVIISIILPIAYQYCSIKKDEVKQAKSILKPTAQPSQMGYSKIHSPKNPHTDSSSKK